MRSLTYLLKNRVSSPENFGQQRKRTFATKWAKKRLVQRSRGAGAASSDRTALNAEGCFVGGLALSRHVGHSHHSVAKALRLCELKLSIANVDTFEEMSATSDDDGKDRESELVDQIILDQIAI
jgi:hypothetical protein